MKNKSLLCSGIVFFAQFFCITGAFADYDKKDLSLKIVTTDLAPKAIGPYSQAIVVGNMVYCAGSIPLNPKSMKVEATTIEAQTEQAIRNMAAILKQAGSDLRHVVKITVFLKDINDLQKMNGVYERMFQGHAPARSAVQVAKLPLDVMVEIECVATLKDDILKK